MEQTTYDDQNGLTAADMMQLRNIYLQIYFSFDREIYEQIKRTPVKFTGFMCY